MLKEDVLRCRPADERPEEEGGHASNNKLPPGSSVWWRIGDVGCSRTISLQLAGRSDEMVACGGLPGNKQ